VECAPPIRVFKAQGFDYDTLKPGDIVTVTFNPGKDGANVGVLVNVQFADGHVLPRPNSPNPAAPDDSPKN
jgi:prepilin-type processing-associated H-X9-DG protein